jgi:uncharacterized protein YbaR (Trm112 family)/SAM-dependent methyltransferase
MNKDLREILACPTCRGPLSPGGLSCLKCGAIFEERDGIPILLDEESRHEIVRFYQGRWNADRVEREPPPTSTRERLQHWFTHPPSRKIGDVTVPNLQKVWRLLVETESKPRVLTVGKLKPRINRQQIDEFPEIRALETASIRLDIKSGPGVDVVGDGHKLPFLDNSVDAVLALTTLKHLRNPFTFVSEVHRVLKPGGLVYAQCVLFDPYHRWPGDYVHFTTSGIVQLFSQFEAVETGVNTGPSYTMFKLVPYYLACLLSFNSKALYGLVLHTSAWALSPIRYLDYFLLDNPWRDFVAFSNYFLGRKPPR